MPDETTAPTPVGSFVTDLVRRALHRGRREIGRAARSGRSRLELRQAQSDLDHFWRRLGKSTYNLVETGEIDHPALRRAMGRIDALEARIDALRAGDAGEAEPDA